MEAWGFLTREQTRKIRREFGSPVYVYDQKTIEDQVDKVQAFPNAFGLTPRYAMKACPSGAIVHLMHVNGLHIDASSGFEATRALRGGIPPAHIMITAQQLPANLKDLVSQGVRFNACSLHQLSTFGDLFPKREVSVRINPGLGSGHSNRTNTGGPAASFGIWHEYLDDVFDIADSYNLKLTGVHTHIGSGADPEVWTRVADMALDVAARMPSVKRLSLGGGFKVGRMDDEPTADMDAIGQEIVPKFRAFEEKHDRRLHLEIEPGSFLIANAGAIITTVDDVVDTGKDGYNFIKIDSGMTEILRPSMYGAQHPIAIVAKEEEHREQADYVVVGHCCESGDILTPEAGNPEALAPRRLPETHIGDILVVGAAGAYCSGMAAVNYNSFPRAAEVLIKKDGSLKLIRKRQSLDHMIENEAWS